MKARDLLESPREVYSLLDATPFRLGELARDIMERCFSGRAGKREAESAGDTVAIAVHLTLGLPVSYVLRRSHAGWRVRLKILPADGIEKTR